MKKYVLAFILIAGLITLSLFIYHKCFEAKVVYVDTPVVFNGFAMTKELKDKFKNTQLIRQHVIDSIEFDLQVLAKKLGVDQNNKALVLQFDSARTEFIKRKRQNEEDNAVLSNQYDKQILEQMSQYILDYGKAHDYDVILGADGNGGLMYAREIYNISEEVKQYINDRYKGIE
jgi:outer membrane protein